MVSREILVQKITKINPETHPDLYSKDGKTIYFNPVNMMSVDIKITPDEVENICRDVFDYMGGCAHSPSAFDYYLSACLKVGDAYHRKDFDNFKEGLSDLLGKLAFD